jgi:hypothetical protein
MTIFVPAKKVVPSFPVRPAISVPLLGLLLVIAAIGSAHAQTFTVLWSFGSAGGGSTPSEACPALTSFVGPRSLGATWDMALSSASL